MLKPWRSNDGGGGCTYHEDDCGWDGDGENGDDGWEVGDGAAGGDAHDGLASADAEVDLAVGGGHDAEEGR